MRTVGMGTKPRNNKKDTELTKANKELQKENEALKARLAELEAKGAEQAETEKQ